MLTDEERERAENLFKVMLPKQRGGTGHKVVQPWRNEITAKNICSCRDKVWLNDNIINQFQELV